jgi:hypothetical protein
LKAGLLIDRALSAAARVFAHGVAQLRSAVTSLIIPWLAANLRRDARSNPFPVSIVAADTVAVCSVVHMTPGGFAAR